MKKQDIIRLAVVAILAGLLSLIVTNIIFSVPKDRKSEVPAVQAMPTSLPDIQHDPSYTSFLNTNALDLTQPVQIGGSQNNSFFNGLSQ